MKARRARFLNKKFKPVFASWMFLIGDSATEENMRKPQPTSRLRELSVQAPLIDITHLDDTMRQKCVEIGTEFHEMDAAERQAFSHEDPSFPAKEKIMLLDTCMVVLEQSEDYEICATLLKMKKGLLKKRKRTTSK